MYSYISGQLVEVNEETIVVDNHGIGYEFFIPKSVVYQLPNVGGNVKIYTYLYVREDAMQFFGFRTKEELALFKLLIGVNGIGPKGALAVLGVLSAAGSALCHISRGCQGRSRQHRGSVLRQPSVLSLTSKTRLIRSHRRAVPAALR